MSQVRDTTPSASVLLRFVAGARALLALLGGVAVLAEGNSRSPLLSVVALLSPEFAAIVLLRTLAAWPHTTDRRWLWVDAAALVIASHNVDSNALWLYTLTVVPVVAMALVAGARQALGMVAAIAAGMLVWHRWIAPASHVPASAVVLGIVVIAFGPAAALLARPNRFLRERLRFLENFNERSDPRQGLPHHVGVLLELLDAHFQLDTAVIGLQGPEPRVFRRGRDGVTHLLDEQAASLWRERRAQLSHACGYVCAGGGVPSVSSVPLVPHGAAPAEVDAVALQVLLDVGPESLLLPLMSYGKPLGHLCLMRRGLRFTGSDVRWLHDCMREVLPRLERSDLLEQLQRETAAGERERIGRDLHDSAVQPYLGLKYGLEALARQAGADNPVTPNIRQLVELTTEELQTLRDVVSGLRRGDDPTAAPGFIQALRRQAERFEALYGLKVDVSMLHAVQLRGSIAKAVLHMFNEALTNVRRHTNARSVVVSLDVEDDKLVMRVRNDTGHGHAIAAKAFVPRSLSERATEVGGSVTVSVQQHFTQVAIALPVFKALG